LAGNGIAAAWAPQAIGKGIMQKSSSRLARLSDQIQQDLAILLSGEVKDPRIGMVTLTAVELSRDHRHANVFFSTLGDAAAIETTLDGLGKASGFLRSRLAKGLRLRVVPELHFIHDRSIETGMRLSSLIDAAIGSQPASSDDPKSPGNAD
jgi:ribosome-binding factor A